MSRTVSAAEAKANLAACLRSAEMGEEVVITRYGTPVAAIVSAADLEQLRRLRAAGPEAGLARLFGLWEDGDALADAVDEVVRQRSAPREPPALD